MGKMKTLAAVLACVVFLCGLCAAQKPSSAGSAGTGATEAWQKEFDDICSKTQDAMTFPPEELKSLVQRCDALEPQMEKLDPTRKKVYLKRLRQCRGLFNYVLDSKKNDRQK